MGFTLNKYHAQKCKASTGETFDSKKELKRYEQLVALEKANLISDLKRQVVFVLIPRQELPKPYMRKGRMHRVEPPCKYIADFTYIDSDGNYVVEDVKGMRTDSYRIKKKLMLLHGYQIMEV